MAEKANEIENFHYLIFLRDSWVENGLNIYSPISMQNHFIHGSNMKEMFREKDDFIFSQIEMKHQKLCTDRAMRLCYNEASRKDG